MRSATWNQRICGIVAAVPKQIVLNSDFPQFDSQVRDQIAGAIGVRQRGWVKPGQDLIDLARPACDKLLGTLRWQAVDVVVCVTQTPVKPAPPTATLLLGELGLGFPASFDVNLGCSGYPYGLWLLSSLLQEGQRGLLIAGDVCSSYLNPRDRATAMLFGDAATVTAVENLGGPIDTSRSWRFVLGSDGRGHSLLSIDQLGYGDDFNRELQMNGAEVFGFTLKAVPEMYRQLMGDLPPPEIVALHQANEMIVQRLAKKLDVPARMNVGYRGNTSAASIPLLMCDTCPELQAESVRMVMLGFGIGWSWAGMHGRVGPLDILEVVEVP